MRTLLRLTVLLLAVGWMTDGMTQTWSTVEGVPPTPTEMEEIFVTRARPIPGRPPNLSVEEVLERVAYARTLLHSTPLEFVVETDRRTKRGKLRGRPVMFAAQSAWDDSWHLVTIEIPVPARAWEQGKPYTHFKVVTPGYRAEHLRGTGASLLMFRIFRGDEQLYVYGRKYPDIDRSLLSRRQFATMEATAVVLYHVPYTPDMHYPALEERGRAFLEAEAQRALAVLRTGNVHSFANSERLIADTVPYEALVSLALIEQTDDYFYRLHRGEALGEILNQYGLHGATAYRNSVSSASAVGPMQFTNRGRYVRERNKKRRWVKVWRPGTYESVVLGCVGADLEPDFMTGAQDLHNAMKAAACLLDREMSDLRNNTVLTGYDHNPKVFAVFGVSAYNGGSDDARRLLGWFATTEHTVDEIVPTRITTWPMPGYCPCVWVMSVVDGSVRPTPLPAPSRRSKFNRENLWYVEKYLFVLGALYEPQYLPP